jgi:hypothetical protein
MDVGRHEISRRPASSETGWAARAITSSPLGKTALQKLDETRNRIVPAATPDDPLRGEGIIITKFDYEPPLNLGQEGELIFSFKVSPPPD